MTTPDEEITGYGGQSSTSPSKPAVDASNRTSEQTTEDVKNKARQASEEVKSQGKAQLDQYRGTAADEIEKVAQSAKAAAAELDNQDRAGLSRYVSDMAQGMVDLADGLRGKSVDELFGDVNRLARSNPGLFIAGSVALGFGLSRFARASSQRAATGDYASHGHSHEPHGSPSGEDEHLLNQAEPNKHVLSAEAGGAAGSGTIGNFGSAGTPTANTPSRSTTGTGLSAGRDGKSTDGGLLP